MKTKNKTRELKASGLIAVLLIGILLLVFIIFFNMKSDNKDNTSAKDKSTKENIKENNGETTSTSTTSTATTTTSTTTTSTTTTKTTTTTKKTTTASSELTGTTSKGYKIEYRNGAYYIDGILIANKSYPLDKNYIPTGTHKATTSGMSHCAECIIEDGYQAFMKMKQDIASTGITMWIQSGYRSYTLQESLYNGYVKRSGRIEADTYSARPGHSEHQTGYAFDVCASKDGKNYPCITSGFNGTEPALWLKDNCYKYGFILRYPEGKDNETGYKHESWHFRYVGVELATKLYNNGNWITLEDYLGIESKYAN